MAINAGNSFRTRDKLNVGAQTFDIHRLEFLEKQGVADLAKLPFSLRILLENLVRCEDGRFVHAEDIRALAGWRPGAPEKEIAFMPARVLLQDFTGVPAIVDLATMREAVQRMGGSPKRINPLFPAMMRDLHLTYQDLGLVAAIVAVTWGAGSLAMGPLTDRIGPRRMMTPAIHTEACSAMAWMAWYLMNLDFSPKSRSTRIGPTNVAA